MFDIDRWREILGSIRSNVLRTVLSGFTVALGLFIFIVLFGFGKGLQNAFSENFFGDADNLISVFTTRTMRPYAGMQEGRSVSLHNEDYDEITKKYKDDIQFKAARTSSSMMVKYGWESGNYSISGSDPEEKQIEAREVIAGRYISPVDVNRAEKVAVIGRLVQKDLIKNANPVGKSLDINGTMFRIIGVFSDSDGDWDDRMITVPRTTLQALKKNSDTLNNIFVTYNKGLSTEKAVALGKSMEKDLKAAHRIDPDDEGGVIVRSSAEAMKDTVQFMLVLTIIVGVIGLGTLIAGVLGISNIMVYIVKERTRELGVRKAIGARPRSIVMLIMQESIVITLISGLVGVGLGVLALKLIGNNFEAYFILNPSVGMGMIVFAFFCLIFAGAVAGFVPAYRASKIKPVEALRVE